MKSPRVVLLAVLTILIWQTAASAQRARFVDAEEFDAKCLKPGQFVAVTYFAEGSKELEVKGFVSAVNDSSFTIAGSAAGANVPFCDLDILIIGRKRAEIILIKHKPVARNDDRARRIPGLQPTPRILASR